ncbi:MAG: tRNA (adenosine(37)-N6)-threonylcarbamoyltransferase complex ATPase subunit type 1 TsaE [Patescibacteria group bacterium]
MKKVITHSLEETQKLAADFLGSLPVDREEALVVGLYGNLGAGKTSFTQALARELGITEDITSPTFVIEKIYETTHAKFARLIHIDAYRLENGKELQNLNFEAEVSNKNNLIVIEWPENVKEILPGGMTKVHFEHKGGDSRELSFS